mmetsp:Transcript_12785/g.31041  ORF Transcript_12785/g.31041 Transcript_12785/m.31041 type:complete len:565 (+) Transcript_12785:531-2225(+)
MRFSVSTITALAALVATTSSTYATATTTKIGSIKVSRAVAATVASESKSSGLGSNLRRRAEDNAEEGEDGQDQDQDQDQQEDQDNDENGEDDQQEENDGGDDAEDAEDADNEQDEDQEDGADDADDADGDGDGDAAASTVSVQGVGCQAFTRELQNVDFDAGNYFYVGQESVVYFNMDLSGYTAQDGDGEQNENDEEADAVSYDTSGSTFMVLADTWMANMAGMAGYEYNGCMQMDEAVVAALTGYVDEAQYQDADEEDADQADDGDEAEADGEADGGERRALRKLRKLEEEDEQDGEEQQQQMMDLYLGAVCDNGSLQLAVFFDNECQAYSPALTYELSIIEIDNSSSQQAAADGEDEAEAQNEEEDALTFYQTLLTATGVSSQYDIDCDEANDICQQFLQESVDTATCQALNADEEEQNEDDAAEEEQQDVQAEAETTYQLYEEDLQDIESTCTAVQKAVSNGEDLRAYLQQQKQYVASDNGLSAGAKAGIVIASFAVMALILYVVLQERKRNPPAKPSSSNDTVGSNDSKKQPLIREDVAQLHKISPRQQSRSYTRKTGDI